MSDLQRPLSRRSFLAGLGLVALAAAPTGAIRLLRPVAENPATVAAERLSQLFADPGEVEPLGRAYLASRADRPGRGELLSELLPPSMTEDMVVAASDEDLRDAIREWTMDDLASGRILEVGGWLLSSTETRLAALVALRP